MSRDPPTINEPNVNYLRQHTELFDFQEQYQWPDLTYDGEVKSLLVHDQVRYSILSKLQPPTQEEEKYAIARCLQAYRKSAWKIPEDFMQQSHFRRVVINLNMRASPGHPYCRHYTTIGHYLGYDIDSGLIDNVRLHILWLEVQRRLEGEKADPIRVFVKYEPHKIAKIQEGRLRLISSVSIVDQVIDHMLFDAQNDIEIKNWSQIPSKAGWAPSEGGWSYLVQSVPGPHMSIDKSAWDWGMPAWVVECDLLVRQRLCMNLNEEWVRLARKRYTELFHTCELMLSNGMVFEQVYPGLQKSGTVNTIATNSRCQLLLHYVVERRLGERLPEPISIGDDTTQQAFICDDYMSHLDRLGCKTKAVEQGMHFGGHVIDNAGARPSYTAKHYFNLMYADEDVLGEMLDSYQRLYAKDRDRLMAIQGLTVARRADRWLSPYYLEAWYDGYMA